MDLVILNQCQVTWTTPELAPPLLTTTPHQREDVSALDRFNVHRCPTRWIFSGTGTTSKYLLPNPQQKAASTGVSEEQRECLIGRCPSPVVRGKKLFANPLNDNSGFPSRDRMDGERCQRF
ncbi:uncharacterized protein TNCV_4418601 [Trichonephila clavipes]|nr:uncharacterized protein TNCV_4418601 [Trichonephila clavipes]